MPQRVAYFGQYRQHMLKIEQDAQCECWSISRKMNWKATTRVEDLRLTCRRCGHEVEVFGTDGDSARRGAVMLREECPNGEKNFYVIDDDE